MHNSYCRTTNYYTNCKYRRSTTGSQLKCQCYFWISVGKKREWKLTWYIFLILWTGKVYFPCLHALKGRLQQFFGFGTHFKSILQDVNGPLCVAWEEIMTESEIRQICERESVLVNINKIPHMHTLWMFKLSMCDMNKCKGLAVRSCNIEVSLSLIDILNSTEKKQKTKKVKPTSPIWFNQLVSTEKIGEDICHGHTRNNFVYSHF